MPAPASEVASVHGAGGGAAGEAPTAATAVVASTTARKSRRRRGSADGGGRDEVVKSAGDKQDYECRFCHMKFEKSQALGGHMNRHRQEREKEQFEQAQQIVSSVAQQIPRTWSSLSTEMTQSPSRPSGNGAIMSSHLGHLLEGTTCQQYIVPPISFETSYKPTSPTNCNLGTQLSLSSGPNCNYYLPSNASNCNIPGNINNMQNQHNQQQLQQWMESMDGFPNATSSSPRSVPHSSALSFHHHHPVVENNMANSLQVTGVPSEFLANMVRNSNNPNDGSSLQVSPSTPTSSQGMYDIIYNSQLLNPFYNGGM